MISKKLKEKINASIILGSYLDTLGFCNGLWEFNFTKTIKITSLTMGNYINYEILSDFFNRGGFNIDISDWNASDDTIMMIATIKACKKGGSQEDFINEYLKITPLLEDIKRLSGIATINSLKILKKTRDPSKILYSSSMGGNGAAMRTHYIGIHFNDINKIIEVSIMASRLTHNYPLGFLSGMAVALFTHWAINDIDPWKWCGKLIELEEKEIIDEIIKKNANDIYDKYMIDKSEFWNVVYKYREFRANRFHLRTTEFRFGFDRNNDLVSILYDDKLKDFSRMGGDGVSAVLMAYDSILLSIMPKGSNETSDEINLKKPENLLYSWQNLVFLSTLHFGDNDTIGAITGMLFGALRGFDGVSEKVLNMLEFKNEIKLLI